MGECEVCRSTRATVVALVTGQHGTLEVCTGCMEGVGYSEGWKDYDDMENINNG